MSEICKNCHVHKLLKEKCWYYWEGKKECSQFQKGPTDPPSFASVDTVDYEQE